MLLVAGGRLNGRAALEERFGRIERITPGQAVRAGAAARAVIYVAPRLDDCAGGEFDTLHDCLPGIPIILVTDGDASNTRRLAQLVVTEVVWTHEVRTRLAAVIERVVDASVLGRLRRRMLASPAAERDPDLIDRLAVIMQRGEAVRTVGELARLCATSRSMLHLRVRRAFGAAATPGSILDCIWLAVTADVVGSGSRWDAAARTIGVHPRTLHRTAARVTSKRELPSEPEVATLLAHHLGLD